MDHPSRRDFLGHVAGAAAVASAAGAAIGQTAGGNASPDPQPAAGTSPAATPANKFNVLFLMSDDMRAELGCYGSKLGCQTPNLDALAKSGVRFDRNYCQFPLCNPSRASLLTARHPTSTTVLGNTTKFRDVRPNYVSLPQLFKENGYVSARAGKIFHGGFDDPKAWTVGYGIPEGDGGAGGHTMPSATQSKNATASPPPPGILPPLAQDISHGAHSDRMVVLDGMGEGHPDYHTADTTIEYLRKYKDQPFFIGCGFVKPHSPPAAPQHFYDLYDLDKLQLTPDFAEWPTVPPGFPKAAIRPRNADLFIGRAASAAEAKEVIRAYLAAISWADWNLGRVVAEVDKLGLRQKTIMVFVCDHGYQLGEKGKWSKAGSLFEQGTRVPLIMVVPNAAGNGQSCLRMVESINIYQTLANLCGLPASKECEGRDLAPLLADPQSQWDFPAHSVWSEDGRTLHGVAVRTEDWRYVEYGPNGQNGILLFDVHADPLEMKNLADDPAHAQTCAKLSPLVREYASRLGKNTA